MLLIGILSNAAADSIDLITHHDDLDTYQEVYELCVKTNQQLMKEEVVLYNKNLSDTQIYNLCACTTPLVLKALKKKYNHFLSCIKYNPLDTNLLNTMDSESTRKCDNESNDRMIPTVTKLKLQCDVYKNSLNSYFDPDKACTGNYCIFN